MQNALKIFKETDFESRKSSKRLRVTIKREDKVLVSHCFKNRRLMAPELTAEINAESKNPMSLSTVKRRLKNTSLTGKIALRKPLLRTK